MYQWINIINPSLPHPVGYISASTSLDQLLMFQFVLLPALAEQILLNLWSFSHVIITILRKIIIFIALYFFPWIWILIFSTFSSYSSSSSSTCPNPHRWWHRSRTAQPRTPQCTISHLLFHFSRNWPHTCTPWCSPSPSSSNSRSYLEFIR